MELFLIEWEENFFSAKTSPHSCVYECNFVYKDICRKICNFVSVIPVTLKMVLCVERFREEVTKCEICLSTL